VLGKSIVRLSVFQDVLGKSIVRLSVFQDVLGKLIVRNDRLAEHRSTLLECLSAHRERNDRLAETLCELLGDVSLLRETRLALPANVLSQLFRRFTEQGALLAHSYGRSPFASALSLERGSTVLK
jgi:hypothetical protein